MVVPGTATFAELLESELNCTNVPPHAGHASGAWNRPLTTPLFVFEASRPVARTGSVDLRSGAPAFEPPRRNPFTDAPPPREDCRASFQEPTPAPKVKLGLRGMRALAGLNALGAGLDDTLTLNTLRRAFRQLAHRYHPDRHQGCSVAEQGQLARTLAEATEHYRVLVAAFRPTSG